MNKKNKKIFATKRIIALVLAVSIITSLALQSVVFGANETTEPGDYYSLSGIIKLIKNLDEQESPFVVLEVTPNTASGSIGYFIEGQEPFLRQYVRELENASGTEARKEVSDKFKEFLVAANLLDESDDTNFPFVKNEYKELFPWDTSNSIESVSVNLNTEEYVNIPKVDFIHIDVDTDNVDYGDFDVRNIYTLTTGTDAENNPLATHRQNVNHLRPISDSETELNALLAYYQIENTQLFYYTLTDDNFVNINDSITDITSNKENYDNFDVYRREAEIAKDSDGNDILVLVDDTAPFEYYDNIDENFGINENHTNTEIGPEDNPYPKYFYYMLEKEGYGTPVALTDVTAVPGNAYLGIIEADGVEFEEGKDPRFDDDIPDFTEIVDGYAYVGSGRGQYYMSENEADLTEDKVYYNSLLIQSSFSNQNWFEKAVFDAPEGLLYGTQVISRSPEQVTAQDVNSADLVMISSNYTLFDVDANGISVPLSDGFVQPTSTFATDISDEVYGLLKPQLISDNNTPEILDDDIYYEEAPIPMIFDANSKFNDDDNFNIYSLSQKYDIDANTESTYVNKNVYYYDNVTTDDGHFVSSDFFKPIPKEHYDATNDLSPVYNEIVNENKLRVDAGYDDDELLPLYGTGNDQIRVPEAIRYILNYFDTRTDVLAKDSLNVLAIHPGNPYAGNDNNAVKDVLTNIEVYEWLGGEVFYPVLRSTGSNYFNARYLTTDNNIYNDESYSHISHTLTTYYRGDTLSKIIENSTKAKLSDNGTPDVYSDDFAYYDVIKDLVNNKNYYVEGEDVKLGPIYWPKNDSYYKYYITTGGLFIRAAYFDEKKNGDVTPILGEDEEVLDYSVPSDFEEFYSYDGEIKLYAGYPIIQAYNNGTRFDDHAELNDGNYFNAQKLLENATLYTKNGFVVKAEAVNGSLYDLYISQEGIKFYNKGTDSNPILCAYGNKSSFAVSQNTSYDLSPHSLVPSDITVDNIGVDEYLGLTVNIAEEYDMVYIGSDISMFGDNKLVNESEDPANPDWSLNYVDNAMDGLMYTNIGDIVNFYMYNYDEGDGATFDKNKVNYFNIAKATTDIYSQTPSAYLSNVLVDLYGYSSLSEAIAGLTALGAVRITDPDLLYDQSIEEGDTQTNLPVYWPINDSYYMYYNTPGGLIVRIALFDTPNAKQDDKPTPVKPEDEINLKPKLSNNRVIIQAYNNGVNFTDGTEFVPTNETVFVNNSQLLTDKYSGIYNYEDLKPTVDGVKYDIYESKEGIRYYYIKETDGDGNTVTKYYAYRNYSFTLGELNSVNNGLNLGSLDSHYSEKDTFMSTGNIFGLYSVQDSLYNAKFETSGIVELQSFDSNATPTARLSGNDLSEPKMQELINYANAGFPIVVSENLVTEVDGELVIRTDRVDPYSRWYDALVEETVEIDDKDVNVSITSNRKINDTNLSGNVFFQQDLIPSNSADYVIINQQQSLFTHVNKSIPEIIYTTKDINGIEVQNRPEEYVSIDESSDNTNSVLTYEFTIENQTDPVPALTYYTVQLFYDRNSNGLFDDSDNALTNEELDELVILDQNGKRVSYDKLQSGIVYTVSRQLPSNFVGVIPWKLIITDNDTGVSTSDKGITYSKPDEAIKINVLQIVGSSRGEYPVISTTFEHPSGVVVNNSMQDDAYYTQDHYVVNNNTKYPLYTGEASVNGKDVSISYYLKGGEKYYYMDEDSTNIDHEKVDEVIEFYVPQAIKNPNDIQIPMYKWSGANKYQVYYGTLTDADGKETLISYYTTVDGRNLYHSDPNNKNDILVEGEITDSYIRTQFNSSQYENAYSNNYNGYNKANMVQLGHYNDIFDKLKDEGLYDINVHSVYLGDMNEWYSSTNPTHGYFNIDGNYNKDAAEGFLENYDIVMIGFTEFFGGSNDVKNYGGMSYELSEAIVNHMDSGNSLLFAHDTLVTYMTPAGSSYKDETDKSYTMSGSTGYVYTLMARTHLGVDRYGIHDPEYGLSKYIPEDLRDAIVENAGYEDENTIEINNDKSVTAKQNYTASGYEGVTDVAIADLQAKGYDIPYQPVAVEPGEDIPNVEYVEQTQGYQDFFVESFSLDLGYENAKLMHNDPDFDANPYAVNGITFGKYDQPQSTSINQVNRGQVTTFPYNINTKDFLLEQELASEEFKDVGTSIAIQNTHKQYYQLNMNDEELIVWFTLGGAATSLYSVMGEDVSNNYYIYTKGNVTYTGAGHLNTQTLTEAQLFVNTMIASYRPKVEPPKPVSVGADGEQTSTDVVLPIASNNEQLLAALIAGDSNDNSVNKEDLAINFQIISEDITGAFSEVFEVVGFEISYNGTTISPRIFTRNANGTTNDITNSLLISIEPGQTYTMYLDDPVFNQLLKDLLNAKGNGVAELTLTLTTMERETGETLEPQSTTLSIRTYNLLELG